MRLLRRGVILPMEKAWHLTGKKSLMALGGAYVNEGQSRDEGLEVGVLGTSELDFLHVSQAVELIYPVGCHVSPFERILGDLWCHFGIFLLGNDPFRRATLPKDRQHVLSSSQTLAACWQ